jgi:multidrug efflux pump subunit AcrA (membrane-fusion protein)
MTVDGSRATQQDIRGKPITTIELLDQLSRFDGPPELFLVNLLAVQCHIATADGGVILRVASDGNIEALAVFPPLKSGSAMPVWLAQVAELAGAVIAGGATTTRALREPDELYGQPARRHLIMVPIRGGNTVSAFVVSSADPEVLALSRQRLELTVSLLSLYEMRLTLQRRGVDLKRLRLAMETVSAVNEHNRFAGAAMAFCNELSSRWNAERVALGFLKGRYVHLKALSHTEKFSRKMKLVQDIEAAMEECLDQNVEIIYPAEPTATFVSRSAADLSRRHGPYVIVSMPLRHNGQELAVVTLERPADQPFSIEELEALRLTCDLCVARLASLHEHDVWFGAAIAAWCRKLLEGIVGPKHTWAKALAAAVLAFILFVVFVKGEYQAESPFVLEATRLQVVPAPFDGFLKSVSVRPADRVEADARLAELATDELRLQLAAAKAEKIGYEKQATAALRDAAETRDRGKMAESQIAQANADKVAEQIKILEYRLAKANIVSPITGFVVTGDLERQIGAPVKTGDVLFEIALLESLRAELSMPEDQIADVEVGQSGQLATVGHPDEKIKFVVERINPIAEVVNNQNVFKVRVQLQDLDLQGRHRWLRPGMEGVAKVDIDKRSYAWLWTHRLTNWIRMKLWI